MFQKKTDNENLFVAIRQLNCMTITTTLLNAAVKSPHSVSVSQKGTPAYSNLFVP